MAAPDGFCDDVSVWCGSPARPTGNCTHAFDCNCLSGYDHTLVYPGTCGVSEVEECINPGPIPAHETSLGTTAALGFNPVSDSLTLTKAGNNVAFTLANEAVTSRSGFDVTWSSTLLSADRAACDRHAMSAYLSGTTQTHALGCATYATQDACGSAVSNACAWDTSLGACSTAYTYHKYTASNVSAVAYTCDADTGPVLSDDTNAGQAALVVDSSQEGNPQPPGRHFVCEGAPDASNRLYCPSPSACPLTQKVTAPTPQGWRWTCPENPVCPPPAMPGYTSPWSLDGSTTFDFYACPPGGVTLNPNVYQPDGGDACSQLVACASGSDCPVGWYCTASGAEVPACPPQGPAWVNGPVNAKRQEEEAEEVRNGGTRRAGQTYYCEAGSHVTLAHPTYYHNIADLTSSDGTYACRGDHVRGEFECASPYSCPVHIAADGTRTVLTCTASFALGTEICPPRSARYVFTNVTQAPPANVSLTVPELDAAGPAEATPYAFERSANGFLTQARTCAAQCGGTCPFGDTPVSYTVAPGTVATWTGGVSGSAASENGPFVMRLDGPTDPDDDLYVTLDAQLAVVGVYKPGATPPTTLDDLTDPICHGGTFDEDTLTFVFDRCTRSGLPACNALTLRGPNPTGLDGRYGYVNPSTSEVSTCDTACNSGTNDGCVGAVTITVGLPVDFDSKRRADPTPAQLLAVAQAVADSVSGTVTGTPSYDAGTGIVTFVIKVSSGDTSAAVAVIAATFTRGTSVNNGVVSGFLALTSLQTRPLIVIPITASGGTPDPADAQSAVEAAISGPIPEGASVVVTVTGSSISVDVVLPSDTTAAAANAIADAVAQALLGTVLDTSPAVSVGSVGTPDVGSIRGHVELATTVVVAVPVHDGTVGNPPNCAGASQTAAQSAVSTALVTGTLSPPLACDATNAVISFTIVSTQPHTDLTFVDAIDVFAAGAIVRAGDTSMEGSADADYIPITDAPTQAPTQSPTQPPTPAPIPGRSVFVDLPVDGGDAQTVADAMATDVTAALVGLGFDEASATAAVATAQDGLVSFQLLVQGPLFRTISYIQAAYRAGASVGGQTVDGAVAARSEEAEYASASMDLSSTGVPKEDGLGAIFEAATPTHDTFAQVTTVAATSGSTACNALPAETFPTTINLVAPSPITTKVFQGAAVTDLLGYAGLSFLGDVDNDGFDDIGVTEAGGPHRLLFGAPDVSITLADHANFVGAAGDITSAGDVNSDGYADFMVGTVDTIFLFFGPFPSGAATYDLGDTGTLTTTTYVTFSGAGVGSTHAAVGDVNGDGIDDVFIGDPAHATNDGRACLFYGRASWIPAADFPLAAGDVVLTGDTNDEKCGATVAGGDVNMDGNVDLLVGCPAYFNVRGRVFVVFGKSDLAAAISLPGTGHGEIRGERPFAGFGQYLKAGGDFNGDGRVDFAVGAPSSGGFPIGRAYVFLGRASASWETDFAGSLIATSVPDSFNGVGRAGGLNHAVGSVAFADLNNDGFDDLVVGGPHTSPGTAFVVYGGETLPTSGDLGNIPNLVTINGLSGTTRTGNRVAAGGDVNGDGIPDLVIGASAASNDVGTVTVVFGVGVSDVDVLSVFSLPIGASEATEIADAHSAVIDTDASLMQCSRVEAPLIGTVAIVTEYTFVLDAPADCTGVDAAVAAAVDPGTTVSVVTACTASVEAVYHVTSTVPESDLAAMQGAAGGGVAVGVESRVRFLVGSRKRAAVVPRQPSTSHHSSAVAGSRRLLGDGHNVYCSGHVASVDRYRINCHTEGAPITEQATGIAGTVSGLANTLFTFLVDADTGAYVPASLESSQAVDSMMNMLSYAKEDGAFVVSLDGGASVALTVPVLDANPTLQALCNAGAGIQLRRTLQQSRNQRASTNSPSSPHRRRRRSDTPAVYTCGNAPASSLFQSTALNAHVDAVWGPGLTDAPAVGLYFPPPVAGTRHTYEAPVALRQFEPLIGDRTGTSLALGLYPCNRGTVYCLGGSADGWHVDAVTDQDALVCPPVPADVSGGTLATVSTPAVGEPHSGWQRQSTCWDRIDVDVPFAGAVSQDCCRRDEVVCTNNGASARCARYSCTPRMCAVDPLPEAEGTGLSTTRSVCQDVPLQVLYTVTFADASVTFSAEVEGTAECLLVQMVYDDVEQRFVVVTECRVANPFRMSEPFTQVSNVDGSDATKLPGQLPQGTPDTVAPVGTFTHGHTNSFGNALPALETPARTAGTTTYAFSTSNCPSILSSVPEDRCIHTTTVFFNRPPAGWGVHCTTNTFDGTSNDANPWVLTWGGDFVCKDTLAVPSVATPCGGITTQPAAAQLQVSAVNVDFCAEVFQVQFTVDVAVHDVVTGERIQGDLSQGTVYLVRVRVVPLVGQEEATTFLASSNITRLVLEGDIVSGAPGYELVLMDVDALTPPEAPVSTSVANFGSRVQQELVNGVVTSVLFLEFEFAVNPSIFFVSTSQPGPGIVYRLLVSGNVDHVGSSSNTVSKSIVVATPTRKQRRVDVVVDAFHEEERMSVTIHDGGNHVATGGLRDDASSTHALSSTEIGLLVGSLAVAAFGAAVGVVALKLHRRKHNGHNAVASDWAKGEVAL